MGHIKLAVLTQTLTYIAIGFSGSLPDTAERANMVARRQLPSALVLWRQSDLHSRANERCSSD